MDWIEQAPLETQAHKAFLNKLDKITIYNHNYAIFKNQNNITFTCIYNCKRLSRQYSIVGKVQGNFLSNNIEISCSLMKYGTIVVGKSHHQKMELIRFATAYNQKHSNQDTDTANSYEIKANPISGEFYACSNIVLNSDLLKDLENFKVRMTDQCQKLGSESQKIFNTILQMIFEQQSNDPYLVFHEKLGLSYSYPIKTQNLYKKIKQLNMIAPHYKIKQDITSQSKNRSFFKKVYLAKTQRTINNPLIIENAIVYEPKFSKKHLEALAPNAPHSKKKNQIIKEFQKLQDNIEIQIARHLEDVQPINSSTKPSIFLKDISPNDFELLKNPGLHQININNVSYQLYAEQIQDSIVKYQHQILARLGDVKHPSMIQYYSFMNSIPMRITQFFKCIRLQQFLLNAQQSLSLITRLDIMCQICQLYTYMHKRNVGYFLNFNDIYITEDNIIKVKNYSQAFSVISWDENKPNARMADEKQQVMANKQDYRLITGFPQDSINKIKMQKKFQSQKADVYALGMILYRVLMDKFPFSLNSIHLLYKMGEQKLQEFLYRIWTLQTQAFLRQGGMIVKLLGQLILKCFYLDLKKRPYVEWLTVILCETKQQFKNMY